MRSPRRYPATASRSRCNDATARLSPDPAPRIPRLLLASAVAAVVGGCAAIQPEQESAEEPEGSSVAVAPILTAEKVDAMLADPMPEPKTVPEYTEVIGEPADEPAEQDVWAQAREGFGLNPVEHADVEQEIQRFNGRQGYFNMIAADGEPYIHFIVESIQARNLPTELLLVPIVESAFRPFAYSHSRAGGIWQFQPATATRFGLRQDWWYDGRRDIVRSTEAALDYIEYLHDFFDGDWLLALAAYNAGEGRVRDAVRANERNGRPTDFWSLNLPAETETYVPRILALREVLAAPDQYGVTLPEIPNEPRLEVVETEGQIDLALVAEMADISIEEVYRLNPAFNRWATHPDGPHEVVVPAERADDVRTALAEREPRDLVRWDRHEIGTGETLGGIARQHGISVDLLQAVNELDGETVRAGDHLLVPAASKPEAAYALSAENRQQAIQERDRPGRQRVDYRIEGGDTLWDVARKHGVSVEELASWNNMAPGDTIRPGQELAVWVSGGTGGPAGTEEHQQLVNYEVRQGDSLWQIASRFSVSVSDIKHWNGVDRETYLQPGQRLELHVDVREQSAAN